MKIKHLLILGGLVAVLLFHIPSFAAAPNIPNIGSAMKEAQSARPKPPPRREETGIEQTVEGTALPDKSGGATIFVRDFKLENAEYLKEADIQAALAPYKGRDLTMALIEEATNKVTEIYHDRGYMVARAYLPPQKAKDGVIIIRVLVGSYGPSSFENKSHVRDWFIKKAIQNNLQEGKPVKKADLERTVLLISDMPGADMPKASIAPGQEPGTSDFFLESSPGKRFGGYLLSDNMGSRYTGRWRFGGGAEVNSPFGIADKLSVFGLTTDTAGLSNAAVNYTFPIGGSGLRLDLGYSHVFYKLADDYEELDAAGYADTFDGTFSYPIIRSSNQNLYIRLNLAHKSMQDKIEVFDQDWKRHSNVAKLGLQHEYWGTFLGRPLYTSVNGGLTYGSLFIPSGEQRELNRAGADTFGDFAYASLGILANLSLSDKWSFSASANGQKSLDKNLDSSEQFNITGSTGVKAYREVISGDNGYLLNAELRYALPTCGIEGLNHALGAYVDTGGWSYQKPDYALKKRDTLSDIGLGYYLQYKAFSMKAQLSQAVGEYPQEIKDEGRTYLSALFMLAF
ncbi:MAG: hypothetical protein LBN28_05560 [Desulfovibrio sp.]|jgi:hemolysin activation/secretion protein|nr:hypothetical protein [Desulfovibrio sp.]